MDPIGSTYVFAQTFSGHGKKGAHSVALLPFGHVVLIDSLSNQKGKSTLKTANGGLGTPLPDYNWSSGFEPIAGLRFCKMGRPVTLS